MPSFALVPIVGLALTVGLGACGGAQPARGRAFCESYEANYIPACRRHCEADLELGDAEGVEACKKKCAKDLKNDDTFSESCAH